MGAAYPVNVPLVAYGASIKFTPEVLRTKTGSGYPEQRLKKSHLIWRINLTWSLSPVEYDLFINWYENDLYFGSLPFLMDFEWGNGLEEGEFEFVEGKIQIRNVGILYKEVSAEVISYYEPSVAPESAYYLAWTSPDEDLFAVYGQAFSELFQLANDDITPIKYDLISGAVPRGLTLNSASLTGTITRILEITTPILPPVALDTAYSATIKTTGGASPITFARISGSLPTGITLNASTGELSGTVASELVIQNTTLPTGSYGQPYKAKVLTKGGLPAISFSVTSGALPSDYSINASTGEITGTRKLVFGSNLVFIAVESLRYAISGDTYWNKLYTFGGKKDITFSLISGALPTGITLDVNTGELTGTHTL